MKTLSDKGHSLALYLCTVLHEKILQFYSYTYISASFKLAYLSLGCPLTTFIKIVSYDGALTQTKQIKCRTFLTTQYYTQRYTSHQRNLFDFPGAMFQINPTVTIHVSKEIYAISRSRIQSNGCMSLYIHLKPS